MELFKRVMALTGSSSHTTFGTMAVRVLRLVGQGTTVDRDIIEWACYIVADSISHPSEPDYDAKFLALEASK